MQSTHAVALPEPACERRVLELRAGDVEILSSPCHIPSPHSRACPRLLVLQIITAPNDLPLIALLDLRLRTVNQGAHAVALLEACRERLRVQSQRGNGNSPSPCPAPSTTHTAVGGVVAFGVNAWTKHSPLITRLDVSRGMGNQSAHAVALLVTTQKMAHAQCDCECENSPRLCPRPCPRSHGRQRLERLSNKHGPTTIPSSPVLTFIGS
jgi:hypothetical protein